MKLTVVGNGAVGLMIAREAVLRLPNAMVTLVAPRSRPGCASVAAAAMFNSFAEVDTGTFKSRFEKEKWLFNRSAAKRWPELLQSVADESKCEISRGFGTYVINNHVSDTLEDENFDAIMAALKEFGEPHQMVNPTDIPFYKPSCHGRAGRAVHIPGEGFVNPLHLLAALETLLEKSGRVTFVDGECSRLVAGPGGAIESAVLADGTCVTGDCFVLAPGANFSAIIAGSQLGLEFPRVFYGVGCTIVLGTGDNTLPKCVRTPNRGLACGVYSAPRDATHTIVGASNLIAPTPMPFARVTSVYTLLKAAVEQINSDYYRADMTAVNVGWRPTSEDTLPMIGRTGIGNLLVATATKRDGLHCSPLIAECIVDLIASGKSTYDISLFKPDRKPVRTMTRADAVEVFVRHTMNANYQHDFRPAKNRMLEQMERMYRQEIEQLHDKVGAHEWGIPPEMVNMYRYEHIPRRQA